jgi:hypothetical protein
MGVPSVVPKSKIWGEKEEEWWDPRVGKQNRETAGAICVLGMKIFLLHPKFTPSVRVALIIAPRSSP